MDPSGKYRSGKAWRRAILWVRGAAWASVVSCAMHTGVAWAQIGQGIGESSEASDSVHGTVLNQITREPISRALVYSPDNRYATLTDDRGHFEFKFPAPEAAAGENPNGVSDVERQRIQQLRWIANARPGVFLARKPGFLDNQRNPYAGRVEANQSEITLYLIPESLIVGHVNIPGAQGDERIGLELWRRVIREGQESWEQRGSFASWADGEFRFWDLPAGTYKLVTEEQLDRDPLNFVPGQQMYGFPPVFYPGTADFATATPIVVGAGMTAQANIAVRRREYYPVKISVGNGAMGQGMNLRVYPLGHPGPGYSLGYNPAEERIEGLLPNGSYTLEASSFGETGSTGLLNFTVSGAAFEGGPLNMIPNGSLTVNVREELSSGQSVFYDSPAGSGGDASNGGQTRQANLQVSLVPMEEFNWGQGAMSQPKEKTQEHVLVIPNVWPGRYRVQVNTGVGYASRVESGGKDVMQEPLVIGLGGSSAPIEVTLRDDGAEVVGTVEDSGKTTRNTGPGRLGLPQCFVYFLPIADNPGQFRVTTCGTDGGFQQTQLPPGTYRVLAFDGAQEDLAYGDEKAMSAYESKGQLIQVEAGQQARVRLKIIPAGDQP